MIPTKVFLKRLYLILIKCILLLTFTFSFSLENSEAYKILQKLEYQIDIKDFIGAKTLAERIYKTAKNTNSKEIAFLIYWLADGFLNYQKGQFNKILEDISGLNLYWAFFREKPSFTDYYYEYLGRLYTLLFQYRRAVIFYILSYRRKPTQKRLLEIIFSTEMAYYDELRPYLDYSIIKLLLKRVKVNKLNPFEKALYEFEVGFYNLLIKNYRVAYKYFKKSFNLDKAFITDGQADYFMGKALEGLKKYKEAYYFYKLALQKVKHPIYKENTLYRLFQVSARIGYYQEANSYYLGLVKFGGLEKNPYLQEATLLIPKLGNFFQYFYWKNFYNSLVAKILWLNFNKDRGKQAFVYFLNLFLKEGVLYPDFVEAWKLLYPHEVKDLKVNPEIVLNFSLNKLKKLYKLYTLNKALFIHFFGQYGLLAIAKYFYLKGYWEKAIKLAEKINLHNPYKIFLIGIIEAYKGKPYTLESYFSTLKGNLKLEALFWLGWGYLLNNRWDLVSLYWEDFLNKSLNTNTWMWEKLFSAYYLALHYDSEGFKDKAVKFYGITLNLLKSFPDLDGLKRWIALRLVNLKTTDISTLPVDKNWQKFLKYLLTEAKKNGFSF